MADEHTKKDWAIYEKSDSARTITQIVRDLPEDVVPGEDIFKVDDWGFMEITGQNVEVGDVPVEGGFKKPEKDVPTLSKEMLREFSNNYQEQLLAQTWSFNVGTEKNPVIVTTALGEKGQAAMLQLAVWGALIAKDGDVQHYNMADGTSGPDINAQQALSLAKQAGAVKTATIAMLNDVSDDIEAGHIQTISDIETRDWPAPKG